MNEILDIQNRTQMKADARAIFVRYSLWFINEHPDDWLVVRPGDLGMNQLDTVVNRDVFGDCPYPFLNRTGTHARLPKRSLAQKKKWARTHRTRPPCFEQAVDYTETYLVTQVDDSERKSSPY
jgi:hypothetical protein